MNDVIVFPDIEKALIKYLLTVPAITALVSTRVYAEAPAETPFPVITVRKLSSRAGGSPRWLEACTMEVSGESHRDVANARAEARLVCETAVAYLNALANSTIEGCVITGPVATTGPRPVPDVVTAGITNPRFIGEVSFTYHP